MDVTSVPLPPAQAAPNHRVVFFSELLDRRVSVTRADLKIGTLTDLVFRLAEPYPEAVGIFISHGWGKPT